MNIPARAAVEIVGDPDGRIAGLLALPDLSPELELWGAPEAAIGPGSSADQLWTVLESIDEVGWVTAAKLLARKRPRLLPVYDRVVKAALQPRSTSFWLPLRAALQEPALVQRLAAIRTEAGVGDHISLLRILDVAVWMRNRGIGSGGPAWGGATPLPFTPANH